MLRFRFVLLAAAFLTAAPMIVRAQTAAEASAAPSASVPAAPAAKTGGKLTAVPFRAGTILSAEISRQKPAFDVESQFDQPAVENPVWIELIVKLDNGRSISRFDYELVCPNGNYSCFAVAEGADGYSVDPDKWIIRSPHPLKYYRLLFPVKQAELASAKELLPVTLKVKLYETTLPASDFKVRVMPDNERFTRVSSVRPEGICNMTYREVFGGN